MTYPASTALSLQGPWLMKPHFVARPSQAAIGEGLKYLCLFDDTIPHELVTQSRASVLPTANAIETGPWGMCRKIVPYNGALEFAHRAEWNILGGMTIITRMKMNMNLYYPSILSKGAPAQTINQPFGFHFNNYYYRPEFCRANATGYRFWYGENPIDLVNPIWQDWALSCGPSIADVPVLYADGTPRVMTNYSGAGSGPATPNSSPLIHSSSNHEEVTFDYIAAFDQQLSMQRILEIQHAPFRELIEIYGQERTFMVAQKLQVTKFRRRAMNAGLQNLVGMPQEIRK